MALTYPTGISPYGNYSTAASNPQYTTVIWTQGGLQGAMAYPMLPNSTVMLMDRDEMVMYIRSKDLSGRENPVTIYDLVKRETPQAAPNDALVATITEIVNKCLDERHAKWKSNKKKHEKAEDLNE